MSLDVAPFAAKLLRAYEQENEHRIRWCIADLVTQARRDGWHDLAFWLSEALAGFDFFSVGIALDGLRRHCGLALESVMVQDRETLGNPWVAWYLNVRIADDGLLCWSRVAP